MRAEAGAPSPRPLKEPALPTPWLGHWPPEPRKDNFCVPALHPNLLVASGPTLIQDALVLLPDDVCKDPIPKGRT